MGFGQKVWKARNAKLGGRCTGIVKGRVESMFFCRGVWGTSPRKCLKSKAVSGAFQCFLGHFSPIPIPPPLPLKIFLFWFTLISRMVLGDGKKSEIRLKSEDSVPWKSAGLAVCTCPVRRNWAKCLGKKIKSRWTFQKCFYISQHTQNKSNFFFMFSKIEKCPARDPWFAEHFVGRISKTFHVLCRCTYSGFKLW